MTKHIYAHRFELEDQAVQLGDSCKSGSSRFSSSDCQKNNLTGNSTLPSMWLSILSMSLCTPALSGCGLHMYRDGNAQIAHEAKTSYTEKVNLLSLVATERENFSKLHDAELAAIRQNQLYHRDRMLFNAAKQASPQDLILQLKLPDNAASGQKICNEPRTLHYLQRRACELSAPDRQALMKLADGVTDPTRAKDRADLIEKQIGDLHNLGWKNAPSCSQLNQNTKVPDEVLGKLDESSRSTANETLVELTKNCAGFNQIVPNALAGETLNLQRLRSNKDRLVAEGKRVEEDIAVLANRLKKLAEGQPEPGDTRKKIAEAAAKVGKAISGAQDAAEAIGAQEKLDELHLDAAGTLLLALEGESIPDEKLKGDDASELRRALVIAQSLPQLAEDITLASSLPKVPPRSSLLIAQKQALIGKELIKAKRELLDKRIDLVRQRMNQISMEASLLALAAHEGACEDFATQEKGNAAPNIALAECKSRLDERILLGYNFLSRSLLTARSEQEITQLEDAYLLAEQNILITEYALKSWDNVIGTPLTQIDGYHTGGLKPESLGDLIFKIGGTGLLGIMVGKVN